MAPERCGGVLAVVGARLNSSRLPGKQLLALAGVPLIERLFRRLAVLSRIDRAVLATTADEFNRPLLAWARAAGREAYAHPGEVNDLVGRVDAVVRLHDPAAVVYCCGDSPLIEPTTLTRLIEAILESGAAIATLDGPTIHEGFAVYGREGWDRMAAAAVTPDEREHVGLSLRKLPDLTVSLVSDDPVFSRVRHRLSVDTVADYRFMREVHRRWYEAHAPESLVSLPWLIGELERDPALAAINHRVRQRLPGERPPRLLLVTEAGRLPRALLLAELLQEVAAAGVELVVAGPLFDPGELELFPHAVMAKLPSAAALAARCRAVGGDGALLDLERYDSAAWAATGLRWAALGEPPGPLPGADPAAREGEKRSLERWLPGLFAELGMTVEGPSLGLEPV